MTTFECLQQTQHSEVFQQPGRAVNEVSRSEKVGSLSVALTQGGLFKSKPNGAKQKNKYPIVFRDNARMRQGHARRRKNLLLRLHRAGCSKASETRLAEWCKAGV